MRNAKMFLVLGFVAVLGPGMTAQQQPPQPDPPRIDAEKRLNDLWKKVDRDQPAKDVIHALETLEQIQQQMTSGNTGGAMWFSGLKHRDPEVRRHAARTMADLVAGPMDVAPTVAERLMDTLNDRDNRVKAECFFSLARLGPHAKPAAPRAIKEMKNDDPRIRRGAVTLLGNLAREEKELIPHVIAALDDPDIEWEKERGHNSVSMLAMMRLKVCKNDAKTAAPKLVQIVEKKKNSEFYQLWALRTLIAVAPDHPLPLKIGMECIKRKEDLAQLNKGFTLLGELAEIRKPATETIPDLIELLKMRANPDVEIERQIKSGALSVLRRMGPAAKEALPFIREMPATRDPNLRGYIEDTIKSIEDGK